ncbi:MAG: anaerobic sulfite reductase subunit AsrB, partial [Thermoplasmata archaeon]|nr:anaerobic sulfite reductase subunit AsrB [Thermoplasmata archaeon]
MVVEGVSWVPRLTRVLERVQHTADTVSLKLDLNLNHQPGQFVQVSVPGVGEIPLSVASFPGNRLMITFRRVGRVTAALYGLGVGDSIGVRGPFGRGFP